MVCPVLAIVPRAALPQGLSDYAELNARLAKQWPKITAKGIVPADAEQWVDVADKRPLLEGL
jgi:ferredoxin